jgi:hypothetical protein
MMKTQSYHYWLKENEEFISDIDRVVNQGIERTQAFDYELLLSGKKYNVNYVIVSMKSPENQESLKFKFRKRTQKEGDQKNTSNGILIVIETISTEKRILTTLGRYMNATLAQQIMTDNASILSGQKLEASAVVVNLRSCTFSFIFANYTYSPRHVREP